MELIDRATRLRLIDILNRITALGQPGGLDRLLADLPKALTDSVPRTGALGIDLPTLVERCNTWEPGAGAPHPLRLLIENAQRLVTGGAIAVELQAVLDGLPS